MYYLGMFGFASVYEFSTSEGFNPFLYQRFGLFSKINVSNNCL